MPFPQEWIFPEHLSLKVRKNEINEWKESTAERQYGHLLELARKKFPNQRKRLISPSTTATKETLLQRRMNINYIWIEYYSTDAVTRRDVFKLRYSTRRKPPSDASLSPQRCVRHRWNLQAKLKIFYVWQCGKISERWHIINFRNTDR